MKTTLKTKTTLNLIYLPHPLKRILPEFFFLMTSHLKSHRTTDIKPELLSGVQYGNGTPHDIYNIRRCPCANKQKRQHFHAKTTSAKLYSYIGVGSRDLFSDKAHTALGMFPVFFPCMLPTPLCGIS